MQGHGAGILPTFLAFLSLSLQIVGSNSIPGIKHNIHVEFQSTTELVQFFEWRSMFS